MFNNIGGKIKTLATIICVLGMIGSAISAIAVWVNGEFLPGLVILVVGCLTSWVGSFFTYGFGELIEDTAQNRAINQQILQRLGSGEHIGGASTFLREVPVAFANDDRNGAAPARPAAAGSWACRICGGRNVATNISCKECGAYK